MTVSVIVPNYNHEKFLRKRLDSIFNQTFKDFEVILLDDASTDGSLKILKEYSNRKEVFHCIFNKVNTGNPFAQWERGINLAKGKYIWIAESDDWADLRFLEKMVRVLDSNSNLALAYCQSLEVDGNGMILRSAFKYTSFFLPNNWYDSFVKEGSDIIKYMIYRNVIPNASAVLFRNNSKLIPYLNVDLTTCGDWWFWINIIKGKKVAFIDNHLNYFRFHSTVTRIRNTYTKRKALLTEKMVILNLIKKLYPEYEYMVRENKKVMFKTIMFTLKPKKIKEIQNIYLEELGQELPIRQYLILETLKKLEVLTSFSSKAVNYLKNKVIPIE